MTMGPSAAIVQWTHACSYDRAGEGFGDPGLMPRTSVRIAKELHTAWHRAGIAGPYILVGHAFGGDHVRTFAVLYMDEVAGIVMDDTDITDLEPRRCRTATVVDAKNSLLSCVNVVKRLPNTRRCHL
jgi:pimeloyl-ACP methyl ester carboxylesterase